MAKLMSLIFLLVLFDKILAVKEYKAAAFEHEPYFIPSILPPSRQEALRIMKVNAAVYSKQASAASNQGAQIIVFPEDGLYGIGHSRDGIQPYLEPIPEVSGEPWVPCTNPKVKNTEILQELSCIALNNSIALVANMGDIKYCTKTDPNCPQDGRYQFNTDVVFDTDGRLLAKYHKEHLFHEEQFNTPAKCEFVTFVTSFQVRFGVFTCFDMLFKSPALDLVRLYGVRNIVFPTAWFDGFPLLQANQYQQAWSHSTCVNLIAANLLIADLGFSGSGIYECGEVKVYTYNTQSPEKRLLVATLIDMEETGQTLTRSDLGHYKITIKRDVKHGTKKLRVASNAKTFKARVLHDMYTLTKLLAAEGELSVCGNSMCCSLTYKLPTGSSFTESFALGAFRGSHNPEGYFLEVCVLFKCFSDEDESCGEPVEESQTVFQSFKLWGNFSSKATVFPGVLASGVKLSQPNVVKFTGDGISSETFGEPLLTAALVGRVYSKDKPEF